MKRFDRKFGPDFLDTVPHAPGVYRFYDEAGRLLYVGKAKNLRRRLAQYRTTRRIKKDRKRRTLVDKAVRVEFETCETELDAALREIRLIQSLRPSENVSGAYSFLYPFIGLLDEGGDLYFCFTTAPEAFPSFGLHGAFRSRFVSGEGFFALMRLLKFVGHPIPRTRCDRLGKAEHSYLFGFRRLPLESAALWKDFFRGRSRGALESLALKLLEHAAARAKSADVEEDLKSVARFFTEEAEALALAIEATGYSGYPVPQRHRDPLFLEYRGGLK